MLRVMNGDGSDAIDAPWQPPCAHGADDRRLRRECPLVELAAVGDVAVAVFADLPGRDHPDPGGPATIRAVLLTGSGRRGSEVIDVSPPEARPGWVVRVASEGDQVVVAYVDSAPGREGIWMRRLSVARF